MNGHLQLDSKTASSSSSSGSKAGVVVGAVAGAAQAEAAKDSRQRTAARFRMLDLTLRIMLMTMMQSS